MGEDWNVCVGVVYVCSRQFVIRPECVCFQSGFISIVLYMQSHVYTSWIHSLCNSSYHFALPGLVFLSRRWVKSLLLLTDPCKSLSHTHIPSPPSWQSCCFSTLLLASPAVRTCFYDGYIQFCSRLWTACLRF